MICGDQVYDGIAENNLLRVREKTAHRPGELVARELRSILVSSIAFIKLGDLNLRI